MILEKNPSAIACKNKIEIFKFEPLKVTLNSY